MTNLFTRQAASYRNQLTQSCSELAGLAEGLVADRHLNDDEIRFLDRWLEKHDVVSCDWPGDILHAKVKEVLADGVVTPAERDHLVKTLAMLIGGRLDDLADAPRVNELAFDSVDRVTFPDSLFCLTGDFVYAPRAECEEAIIVRRGRVNSGVTKKLNYLIIGGLGSDEWKHGSYGTKITKAMQYKRDGCPILVVPEDVWAASLQ